MIRIYAIVHMVLLCRILIKSFQNIDNLMRLSVVIADDDINTYYCHIYNLEAVVMIVKYSSST